MDNLEHRVFRLEHASIPDDQKIADLLRRVAALEQNSVNQAAGGGGGGGGGGPEWTLYTCTVPGNYTGPTTFPATLTSVMGPGTGGTFNVNVAIPGPTVAGKMGYVLGDGAAHYYLISQSCT